MLDRILLSLSDILHMIPRLAGSLGSCKDPIFHPLCDSSILCVLVQANESSIISRDFLP
jgi:hypothetical protein